MRTCLKAVAVSLVLAALFLIGAPSASAAGPGSFSGASSAVQGAFVAVQTAGRDGGNTTGLVAQLNSALALIQKANAENASDPAQAAADLQSAQRIAQEVQASAPSVDQQGVSARQLRLEVSVASAAAVVLVAAAVYLYGDRAYRKLWLRVYAGHVVRKGG